MAVLATQNLSGTVGRVYELRTVGKDNTEVIDFTVAVTPRRKVGEEWVDGETYWSTITAWGRLAKNISESLKPGDRVLVIGRTDMKPGYTNKEGVEVAARPVITADFVGLELGFHPASSNRPARGGESSSERPASKSKPAPKETSYDDDLNFDDDDDSDFPPF